MENHAIFSQINSLSSHTRRNVFKIPKQRVVKNLVSGHCVYLDFLSLKENILAKQIFREKINNLKSTNRWSFFRIRTPSNGRYFAKIGSFFQEKFTILRAKIGKTKEKTKIFNFVFSNKKGKFCGDFKCEKKWATLKFT